MVAGGQNDRVVSERPREVERAWLVEQFHQEAAWDTVARNGGFLLKERRDLRAAAMPSILRLYRQARTFYLLMASPAKPLLARLVRRSTHNAISALMLPHACGLHSLEYRLTIWERQQGN